MNWRCVSRTIDTPAGTVWDIIIDTDCWSSWGPSVRGIDHVSSRRIERGTTGAVRTALGVSLPFEVTTFDDGGRWSWNVGGFPATDHRVDALGADRCEISFGVPSLLLTPYLAVCAGALRRIDELAIERTFGD